MATYKAIILSSKKDLKKDGTVNIKIRITHNRKVNYIPTQMFIFPEQMNRDTGQVTSGKNKAYINMTITDWLLKCQKYDIELGERRHLISVGALKDEIMDLDNKTTSIDFYDYTSTLMKITETKTTAENYYYCAKALKTFAGPILPFSDINLNFLLRYEAFLRRNGVKNGIVNYMKTFRAIFNKARDHYNNEDIGLMPIPHYPFRKYRIPKRVVKTKDHVLTKDEMLLLIKYKPANPGEDFAKDMFLLMFYLIGIETKDLFYLPKAKKGRVFYNRFKTNQPYSIKIEPEAQAIIDKYPGQDTLLNFPERFKRNRSFTKHINNYLHGAKCKDIIGVFTKIGIFKDVTSKWARHTWATFARNDCNVNKDDVALCLGHQDSENKVTDVYIRYDYRIIDESNKKVISFITRQ